MEPLCKRRTVAFHPRVLCVLMVAGLLLNACSRGPMSTGGPDSETPAAPVLSVGTRDQTSVTVTWTAPATDEAITGYELQWRSSSVTNWTLEPLIAGTQTSYTITGLQLQTSYEVRVRARFATTASAWSTSITVSTTAPLALPAPTLSEPTARSNSIAVTWTAPATSEPVTEYELQWRSSSDTDWTVEPPIARTQTSYTITGLQPQNSYEVRVRARFATTASAWSTSITVSTTAPLALPAPTLSEPTARSNSIAVTWTAPATSEPVTEYELQWRSSSVTNWTAEPAIAGTQTSYTITGLQPQNSYEVRMRARFATTAGAWSESITVSTAALPAPTLSEPTAGSNSIAVTWTAPATSEPVTGYELNWRSNTDADWTAEPAIAGTQTSYTITGLQPQNSYEVRVRPLFATTAGAWSESITVSTAALPAPTLSEPTARSNSITVTWTLPTASEAITGYELQWRSSTDTDWTVEPPIASTQTSYTIAGVQPQNSYEVRVRARFATTAGAWSESITVSTAALPAPTLSEPTAGSNSITVTWTAPTASEAITGYELNWRSNTDADWTVEPAIAGTQTSYTITGLQPQNSYEVRVRPLFATTAGAWSESITVSTTALPAPTLSEPTARSNSITVTWTLPTASEAITGYELNWRSSTDADWTVEPPIAGTQTSYTITGLQPQNSYEVRVRPLFATTAGAWSESITVSTTAPARPTLSQTAASGTSITVTWVAPATNESITGYELNWRVLTYYPDLTRLRASNSGTNWTRVAGIASTASRYTITGLQPRSIYEVRVRAKFGGGAGPWSAILSCNTDAFVDPPVVGFFCPCRRTVSEAGGEAIRLWHAAAFYFTPETFPASYKYEVSETEDMLESASKGEFATPSMSLEGVSYSYYVVYPEITIRVDDDDVDEPDSTVTVQILPDPRYQVAVESSFKITITDDDDPPSLDVDDVTVTEGDSGTVNATFTVRLSTASGRTVTVDWATSDGTATAGADYTTGSGTLTFAAGETEKTFDVAVTGDTVDEPDETYTVTLSNAGNASISDATATGTITDDD